MALTDKKNAAKGAITTWYYEATRYPENFSMTLDQFFDYIEKTSPTFLDNFGASVLTLRNYLNGSFVDKAMGDLAERTQGKVTKYPDGSFRGAEFFDALQSKIYDYDFKRVVFESKEVAKKGLEEVASFGKNAIYLYLGIGALALFLSLRKK